MVRKPEGIKVTVSPDLKNLSLVRTFVGALADQCGIEGDDRMKVIMSVDEACANSIENREKRAPGSSGPIEVGVQVEDHKLVITVEDPNIDFSAMFERPFDADRHMQEFRTRGLGLQVIRSFMDEVEYVHNPGKGNHLTMVKYT